jgi:hypothetical protein
MTDTSNTEESQSFFQLVLTTFRFPAQDFVGPSPSCDTPRQRNFGTISKVGGRRPAPRGATRALAVSVGPFPQRGTISIVLPQGGWRCGTAS